MRARTALAGLAVLLLTGCSSFTLPGEPPTDLVPSSAPVPAPSSTGNLSPDGFDAAQRMSVRVRNIGCGSVSTGSGFAIDENTLITNRHVVADSAELQLSTYDGRDVTVATSASAALSDLALVRTADALPSATRLGEADPAPGDPITVVGYPEGGELTVTSGRVIGSTPDPLNSNLGEVLLTDAAVEPGSSGSAVLDSAGAVVGVVYAKNQAGQSFVVPVSTLRTILADETALVPTVACSDG
ncbi:serine protease [Cellulomonas sp. RIT-PI-Y]|uniref:S1C family serine protease n=1 Tax=Cellulomonas sp. RIT-PI-Y TaxID=3035297 RepID=UPI0021D9F75A|nr:serine protease [Cellulomonas sp. RIT-PI-Y]